MTDYPSTDCLVIGAAPEVTLNVYTQAMDDSLRTAVDRVGNELFNIVHSDEGRLDSVPLAASKASRGATEDSPRATNEGEAEMSGSSGWTRTSNPPVNSRMLCH